MQLTQLKLTNFRNYNNQSFEFAPKKNIIIGNNGVGKTNIVEAIYYLALTKSFRVSNDLFLINNDSEYSIVEGKVKDIVTSNYKIIIEKSNKRVFIDNNQIRRLSDYISKINVINFSGEDLKLIKDSPSIHRQLMNMEISQLDNQYLKTLSIYNKILKQRNIYLKKLINKQTTSQDFLFILTEKLIDYGLIIYNLRKTYIYEINKRLNEKFKKISKKDGLVIKYCSDFEDLTKIELINKYKKLLNQELNYGQTRLGIHLDDFIFYFKDNIAKNYLSEGEQKNAIIAFKLSEIEIFNDIRGSMPVLILDDLFSELDKTKIRNILKFLNKDMQIFITTTDLENIDKSTIKNSKVFNLLNDKVEETIYE